MASPGVAVMASFDNLAADMKMVKESLQGLEAKVDKLTEALSELASHGRAPTTDEREKTVWTVNYFRDIALTMAPAKCKEDLSRMMKPAQNSQSTLKAYMCVMEFDKRSPWDASKSLLKILRDILVLQACSLEDRGPWDNHSLGNLWATLIPSKDGFDNMASQLMLTFN